MCLITSPREKYIEETYIAPRRASTTSQVYRYSDGTFARGYAPSSRSIRSTSTRRSSRAYVTGVPATSTTTTSHVQRLYPAPAIATETAMVPVNVPAGTRRVLVSESVSPRSTRSSKIYTTQRVSPAVVIPDRRIRTYY